MKWPRSILTTAGLAVVFISLGSLKVLLIKFSENEEGKYEYLPVTVNVSSELIKLVVCLLLSIKYFIKDHRDGKSFCCSSRTEVLDFAKWSVPGALYFMDNLIAFYIIRYFQPAMVVLLGNFYIITTAVLFRILLKRKLNRTQWVSLFILFLSIMILSLQSQQDVQVDHHRHHAVNHLVATDNQNMTGVCQPMRHSFSVQHKNTTNSKLERQDVFTDTIDNSGGFKFEFNEGYILVLIQCIISSTANVYNEKIFKEGAGMEESIYIQNSKLYFFGVIFNAIILLIQSIYRGRLLHCGFFYGHNIYSVMLTFVTAGYGLTVALILKFRDNMFHVMSTQATTVLMISASMYFFNFRPPLEFFLSAPIVLSAIYLFNITKSKKTDGNGDYRPLENAEDGDVPEERRALVNVIANDLLED
ncbi:UDP-sugar transporter protein SLC35A5-like [Lineus longissimus]|uniref:UDP-sugar transporter protein SLC35A5-like n=1 Tax=Lineus longissimus TaxID=88925 RepID=UPI00315C5C8C